VYAARVVFPSGGKWAYAVYDGFDEYGGAQTHTFAPVTIGGGSVDGTPLGWTIGGSIALLLVLLLLVLTPRIRRSAVAVPATGVR
jgi:hypothetical protein